MGNGVQHQNLVELRGEDAVQAEDLRTLAAETKWYRKPFDKASGDTFKIHRTIHPSAGGGHLIFHIYPRMRGLDRHMEDAIRDALRPLLSGEEHKIYIEFMQDKEFLPTSSWFLAIRDMATDERAGWFWSTEEGTFLPLLNKALSDKLPSG